MKSLIKPQALRQGDTIATITLSKGNAGKYLGRYYQGKSQFEKAFNVKIIETPHALCSPEEIYDHPEWRLDDLMWALENKDVKGILCNIGGDDTIRLLRHMKPNHFDTIRNNPKVFMGISDSTINHYMFYHAGVSSMYSASLLFGYAENGGIPEFMVENTKKTLFDASPIGVLPESDEFIIEQVNWGDEHIIRQRLKTTPWRYIQGTTKVSGRLIGGCFDSMMECMVGTMLFPKAEEFKDAILFIETSEERPSPDMIKYWLRTFGANGILENLKGILFGRPGGEFRAHEKEERDRYLESYEKYDEIFLQVCKEYDCQNLAIVTNMDFGHSVPQLILPYGTLAEIDPVAKKVSILEAAVL